MFRFIIGAIISIFILSLLRMIMAAISREMDAKPQGQQQQQAGRPGPKTPPAAPPNIAGGELRKCPTCATYHTVATIAGRTSSGEMVHFCSLACREKYKAA